MIIQIKVDSLVLLKVSSCMYEKTSNTPMSECMLLLDSTCY